MKNLIQSLYVNGSFVAPVGIETSDIISPLDGKSIATINYANDEDTRQAIRSASDAQRAYGKTTIVERAVFLRRIHEEIVRRIDDLIEATILEYGATKERANWSNLIAANTFANQISVMENYPFEKKVNESTVRMEPVGTSALFTPWNSVAGSIAVKIATALSAGCTIVLKPSEFGAWQAQILMECIDAAGLPPGVVNMVIGRGEIISRAIMESNEVTKISFTGSTLVGRMLAREALNTMKRITLELGGKSANIILDDADLDTAIPMALQASFMNNGQACIAGSRLLIPATKSDEIKARLIKEAEKFLVGNPFDENVKIGPLASQKQYDRVQQYILSGIKEGAELIYGGPGMPPTFTKGFYVRPTIFMGASNKMTIAREEIFGPVLTVISYENEETAIEIANNSDYGLMAFISSRDYHRAQKVANQLKVGRVLINTLKHDPIAPFGGFKNSGIGRENGSIGLEEFLEAKTIIA
jgi:aldehyde dehydrogenase (NAD+)